MSSSTLVMAIQHPQRSFGFYIHSDHDEHSDHGYERLHPPNATGFAPSHMNSDSSSTLPHGLPLAHVDLSESQYQNTSINNPEHYSNIYTPTITDKWTRNTGSDFLLHTQSTIMADHGDGFRDTNTNVSGTSLIHRQIYQQNIHGLGPNRNPSSALSPSTIFRSHDQVFTPHPQGSGAGSPIITPRDALVRAVMGPVN